MTIPAAPRGVGEAGRHLWRSVLADFDLDEHELVLLRQAVRVADLCEQLHEIVVAEGPILDNRVHPASVELRMQRILLARLIVALRVPLGEEEAQRENGPARLQRRAVRGVYGLHGGVA